MLKNRLRNRILNYYAVVKVTHILAIYLSYLVVFPSYDLVTFNVEFSLINLFQYYIKWTYVTVLALLYLHIHSMYMELTDGCDG